MDVIQRLEPVVIEIERERECVCVVAHQAILRAIYGYFTKTPLKARAPARPPVRPGSSLWTNLLLMQPPSVFHVVGMPVRKCMVVTNWQSALRHLRLLHQDAAEGAPARPPARLGSSL